MIGSADHEDNSSWDLLASELGLEAAPKPPSAPAPQPIQPEAVPEPEVTAPPEVATPVEVTTPVAEKIEPVVEAAPIFEVDAPKAATIEKVEVEDAETLPFGLVESKLEGVEETVLEEGLESFEDAEPGSAEEVPAEGAPEGDGTGRRRRRRRRRKKGSGDAPANVSAAPAPVKDTTPVQPIVPDPDMTGEVEIVEVQFPSAEIVGEAASELEDDEDSDSETPHAAIEELEEDSTEPLPEWKVTAWTDLIATLYRPQDR